MTLTIHPVPASRGARWMQDGLRQFARHPVAFGFMFAVTAAAAILLSLIPGPGTLIVLSANPLICLGFMVATEASLRGGPVHPGHFISPLRTDSARRRSLIGLSLFSGLINLGLLIVSQWIDGGASDRLAAVVQAQGSMDQMQQVMQDPRLRASVTFRTLGMLAVMLAFWHAPAFVHWGRQGWPQALFSSALCIWRNKGAMLVFGLTWVLVFMAVTLLARLLLAVLGLSQLSLPFVFGLALVFVTAAMVSMLFSFTDSVREAGGSSPESPPGDTPA